LKTVDREIADEIAVDLGGQLGSGIEAGTVNIDLEFTTAVISLFVLGQAVRARASAGCG